MKAVVWHGIGDIRLDDVPDPQVQEPTDAVIDITRSAICGTDLHFVRGTMAPMAEGTILGHEAVGVVTEVGSAVRGLTAGDRVVVSSTVSCGMCRYCRMGQTAQCDVANPNGPQAGTCFFGGPESTGPVNGLQAEKARIPWAVSTLIRSRTASATSRRSSAPTSSPRRGSAPSSPASRAATQCSCSARASWASSPSSRPSARAPVA